MSIGGQSGFACAARIATILLVLNNCHGSSVCIFHGCPNKIQLLTVLPYLWFLWNIISVVQPPHPHVQLLSGKINIEACSGFAYEYTLNVEGKSLKKFSENKSKTSKSWALHLSGEETRVVFGNYPAFVCISCLETHCYYHLSVCRKRHFGCLG